MKNNLFVKIILIFIVAALISIIAIKNLINVKYRESVVDELKKIHIIEVHLKEINQGQELEILHNGMVLGNISEEISGLGYKNKNIMSTKIKVINTISSNKIDVNFNQNDDELSLESISIPTEGDIDFNSLVKTLINLIGKEKELEFEFQEELFNPKNGLIKETLENIYNNFNKVITHSLTQTP